MLYKTVSLAFCASTVAGYAPAMPSKMASSRVARVGQVEMAKKYGKDVGQIALKSLVQRGLSVISKSANPVRSASNIQIFDFELSREDIADELGMKKLQIDKLLRQLERID